MVPFDNGPLKSGFIFIVIEGKFPPHEYQVSRLGSYGYFAKLDPANVNGFEPVTVAAYSAA